MLFHTKWWMENCSTNSKKERYKRESTSHLHHQGHRSQSHHHNLSSFNLWQERDVACAHHLSSHHPGKKNNGNGCSEDRIRRKIKRNKKSRLKGIRKKREERIVKRMIIIWRNKRHSVRSSHQSTTKHQTESKPTIILLFYFLQLLLPTFPGKLMNSHEKDHEEEDDDATQYCQNNLKQTVWREEEREGKTARKGIIYDHSKQMPHSKGRRGKQRLQKLMMMPLMIFSFSSGSSILSSPLILLLLFIL